MNKEQQELLDEAYVNYCMSYKDGHEFYEDEIIKRSYTKEEFINKCKTDTEFSERWGLKIEEQTILKQVDQNNPVLKGSTALYPRKLITVTYNNKTIESYE
jgi:hypothetical protein